MRVRHPRGRLGSVPSSTPGRWFVTLPAWGDRCVRVLTEYTIPAIAESLRDMDMALGRQSRPVLSVATDAPAVVEAAFAACGLRDQGAVLQLSDPPGPDGAFMSMSNFHRKIIAAAGHIDRVLLLTADMVISRELMLTCELQLRRHRVVCCAPPRTLEDGGPPIGASGAALLRWAWDNRHPMTEDCTWPDGRSYDIWRMYFAKDGEVAARVFLPHPIAVRPESNHLQFTPTIDVNLAGNFPTRLVYMITSPAEGAVVELSPREKEYIRTETMQHRFDAGGPSCPQFIPCSHPRHRMFFGKKVTILGGGGDCGDGEVMERVMGHE